MIVWMTWSSWLIDWFIGWLDWLTALIDWFIDLLIWLIHWLIDWLDLPIWSIDWFDSFTDWLIDWLTDLSIDWLIDWFSWIYRFALDTALDSEFHQLVKSWLVCVSSKPPYISKTFEVRLKCGGGRGSNKVRQSFLSTFSVLLTMIVCCAKVDFLVIWKSSLA